MCTSNVHILSPETDNCLSWIRERERMTVENVSWSKFHERTFSTWQESNLRPPVHQLDLHRTEPWCRNPLAKYLTVKMGKFILCIYELKRPTRMYTTLPSPGWGIFCFLQTTNMHFKRNIGQKTRVFCPIFHLKSTDMMSLLVRTHNLHFYKAP